MLKFEVTENLQAAFSQFAEIAGALER